MVWNKRKQKRRTLLFYLEVVESTSRAPLGRVGDISDGGLMLLAHNFVEPGTEYDATILIPEECGLKIASLEVRLRVQWCRPDKNPSFFGIGCAYVSLPEELRSVVTALIQVLAFEDGRVIDRFKYSP